MASVLHWPRRRRFGNLTLREVMALVESQEITVGELERWVRLGRELARLDDQALMQQIVRGGAQNAG